MRATALERFYAKFEVNKTTGCWVWQAYTDKDGYGRFFYEGTMVCAHRWAFQFIGRQKIPDTLNGYHLCRYPSCVNPSHLEVIPHCESARRGDVGINQTVKTHCPQGHAYTEENTYQSIRPSRAGDGGKTVNRACRACTLEHMRKSRAISKHEDLEN